MTQALDSANFTITITVANHTSPVDVPLPKTTCYIIPYGWIGSINGLLTMYMVICLTQGRTPLFPRRPRRHRRLFFWLFWSWILSVLTLQLINMGMCAGSYVALFWIILVKFLWSICWMAALGNGIKNGVDKRSANSSSQPADQEAGTTTDGERDDATIRLMNTDATTANDEGNEDAITRVGTTNAEIEAEGETTEPRGTSIDGKSTTTAEYGWTQDNTDLSRHISMLEVATDPMEPPPSYESIAQHVVTPSQASESILRSGFEAQRATASSSRSMGTQTDPTLSPTAAAEALSTSPAEATPTTPAKANDPPPFNTVPQVVTVFIVIVVILLTLLAIFMLIAPVFLDPGKQGIELVALFFTMAAMGILPFFVMLVSGTVQLTIANIRRRKGQKGGQYTELAQTEDEETGGIANAEETQDGSDSMVHSDRPLLPTNLDEDNRGGDEEEVETYRGVGNGIEPNGPTSNQQVPVENTAESTPSKKEPPESWIVIPQVAASMVIMYGFVLCTELPYVLLSVTTGNTLGLPNSSKLSIGLSIAYILASKIPMLCF